MDNLFIIANALVPFVVLGLAIALVRSVLNGDFRVDPNHRYDCDDLLCGECRSCLSWEEYQHCEHSEVNVYEYENDTLECLGKVEVLSLHTKCAERYLTLATANDPSSRLYICNRDTRKRCWYCD